MTNTIENKKGNSGWIIGNWNTGSAEVHWPRGESRRERGTSVKFFLMYAEVKSCGKKQMTLMEKSDGRMTKNFHHPDRAIYQTKEDAIEGIGEMFKEFVAGSLEWAPKNMEAHKESSSHYKWWTEEEAYRQSWIDALKNGEVKFEIVER